MGPLSISTKTFSKKQNLTVNSQIGIYIPHINRTFAAQKKRYWIVRDKTDEEVTSDLLIVSL
jgi:hypothetical protein